MRFARILVPAQVKAYGLGLSQSRDCIIQWSKQKFPTKTPVRVPETLSHVSPAFSIASYETSSNLRCDGSRVSTSWAVMPKKVWSKSRASSSARKAPFIENVPGRSDLERWKPLVEKRGLSNSFQPSVFSRKNSQNWEASRAPPGHRHPILFFSSLIIYNRIRAPCPCPRWPLAHAGHAGLEPWQLKPLIDLQYIE